jgi:hypothetical protein
VNIIEAVKKKAFLFLIPSLALVGVPFFAGVSVLPAPIETKAATSYIDVGSGLDSLTIGSFYMFGAYAEESGTPYVYLLTNPVKGGFVRVPCLSKTDASHPCGIVDTDFTASCLSSILLATNYDTGYCFAFTDYLSVLYADSSNSYALSMSTASSANTMTSVTFDSMASPETCTLSNWEYQITSPSATFKGFASTADSGFSTSLLVYPLAYTSFESLTAVGFSKGLAATGNTYTATTAQAAYQGLSYAQRQLFSYYINGVKTESTATQAAENILIAGVSAYQALLGSASKPFQSKTPSLSIDYTADAITGFDDDETYYLSYGTDPVTAIRVSTTGGSLPFQGTMDNVTYDCAGQTSAIHIYNDSSTGGGDMSSDDVSLALDVRSAAPATVLTAASLSIDGTASDNIDGLFDTELRFTAETGVQYLCLPSASSFQLSEFSNYVWVDSPDFTAVGLKYGTADPDALVAETSYTIYKRTHSTTTSDSLPEYDTTTSAYVGATVTTLTTLEATRKRALIANYATYQTEFAALDSGASSTNLAKALASAIAAIKAATSVDALGGYLSGDTSTPAFEFAKTQDNTIASLTTAVALQASDSAATEKLLADELAAINALDYSSGATQDQITAIQSECVWKAAAYRYRETQSKALVDYFNSDILSKATTLSSANTDALWTTFNTAFQGLITTLGTDLATSQTACDTALASAKTTLTNKLQELMA